jgi:hypothetical protein
MFIVVAISVLILTVPLQWLQVERVSTAAFAEDHRNNEWR